MKLKKEEVMALVESGLFIVGAVFLSVVFFSPENPEWALWVGLAFALAGGVLCALPVLRKGAGKFANRVNEQNAVIKGRIDAAEARAEQKIVTSAESALQGAKPASGAAPLSAPAAPAVSRPPVQIQKPNNKKKAARKNFDRASQF